MTTLTPDQLAALLRVWAAGYYADEAAIQLLCQHRTWLTRPDFRAACVEYDHDGTTPIAWIVWNAVPGFLDDAGCSSSEARILRLAAELAGVHTNHTLADLLSSLDDHNSQLVLDAIAHVLQIGGRQ